MPSKPAGQARVPSAKCSGDGGLFCRRAAPRQKAAPFGGQRTLRSEGSVGAFLPPGRPKAKSGPLGGQRTLRSKGSVGAFLFR